MTPKKTTPATNPSSAPRRARTPWSACSNGAQATNDNGHHAGAGNASAPTRPEKAASSKRVRAGNPVMLPNLAVSIHRNSGHSALVRRFFLQGHELPVGTAL